MRRPVLLIVVGAVVLGLVVSAALVFGVVVPRLRPEPDPGPTYAPGELTPEESTVVAAPQPDGTVRIEQVLIFDAGSGTDFPATWYVGGTLLGWDSDAREVQYGVIPRVVAIEAREVPDTGDPVPLEITREEHESDEPLFAGARHEIVASGPWSPGRHRIEFTVVLGDVWVEVSGTPLLVLPLRFASGPGQGQPADVVRLTVRGAGALQCPATDAGLAARRVCGPGGLLTYTGDGPDQVEAVTAADLTVITAEPVPIRERRR